MSSFPAILIAATLLTGCGGKIVTSSGGDAAVGSDDGVPDTFEAPDSADVDTSVPDSFVHDSFVPDADLPDDFPPGSDRTTGLVCASDGDCDTTGAAIAHCSKDSFVVGPLNSTPVCMQFDATDVCTPSDATTVRFCDADLGLCTKQGTNPAMCSPMCILNADGTWRQKCTGLNGCNFAMFSPPSTKAAMFGTCMAGCRVDAECPSGSKCDPLQRFCSKLCAADADCKKGWSSAPANWKCDTARGACTFVYAKKVGDTCSSSDECLCLKASSGVGRCTSLCRPGDACPTGFTCDANLPATTFKLTTQPPELVGQCLRNCTTGTDCGDSFTCEASAGLLQKTCHPKL